MILVVSLTWLALIFLVLAVFEVEVILKTKQLGHKFQSWHSKKEMLQWKCLKHLEKKINMQNQNNTEIIYIIYLTL